MTTKQGCERLVSYIAIAIDWHDVSKTTVLFVCNACTTMSFAIMSCLISSQPLDGVVAYWSDYGTRATKERYGRLFVLKACVRGGGTSGFRMYTCVRSMLART